MLSEDGVRVHPNDLERLARELSHGLRGCKTAGCQSSGQPSFAKHDILGLILEAKAACDRDEALWRAFLAAHFGRPSADRSVPGQIESAASLLCGFGSTPVWTWATVSSSPRAFHDWLFAHRLEMAKLSYGNHRKFESKRPEHLWAVIDSFLCLVHRNGDSPAAALAAGWDMQLSRGERFHALYEQLSSLHRFGRTGSFDFVMLLVDMAMVDAEPESCYLVDSTGPLKGARRLWKGRSDDELERLAASLARRLGVSPVDVEDALCNWQKLPPM